MKKKIFIFTSLAIIFITVILLCMPKNDKLGSGTVAFAEYSSAYYKTFGEFSAATASEVLSGKKENTCYSSLSLFAAMSLCAEVTSDTTQEEILKSMDVDSMESLEESYAEMLSDIAVQTSKYKITLANSFWTRNMGVNEQLESVIERMEHKLDCEVFIKDEIKSAEVNSWVNEKTNGLIEEIIDRDDYIFLLANSLYYKSKWASDNIEKMNKKQKFYPDKSDEVEVEFLELERGTLEYKIAEDYTYVEVPLMKGKALMVLPNEDKSLEDILKKATLNDIIATSTSNGIKKEGIVNIRFPELNISCSLESDDIEEVLRKCGINQLFDGADWTEGLSGSEVDIIQKTKVIMNEDGIEAAAATMIGAVYGISEGEQPDIDLDITYDRPFLYVIMNDGVPLFIGTVYNPAE